MPEPTPAPAPAPPSGLPLTADERKLIEDKIAALEKREYVSKADVQKIVEEVLAAREKPKPDPAPAAESGDEW